jgi:hypothetical protein
MLLKLGTGNIRPMVAVGFLQLFDHPLRREPLSPRLSDLAAHVQELVLKIVSGAPGAPGYPARHQG